MRWESLFADLSAQLEAEEAAELAAEVADRTRFEVGRLAVADMLAAAVGEAVRLRVRAAGALRGTVVDTGPDWLLLRLADGAGERLVAVAAVVSVAPAPVRAAPPPGPVAARYDLRRLLRGMAQRREPVGLLLTDGAEVIGTVDAVGADHIRVAEHPADEPRRAAAVTGHVLVPLAAVAVARPLR